MKWRRRIVSLFPSVIDGIYTGKMVVRTVAAGDWPNIERLFGERGACGGCWCMSWRVEKHGKAWQQLKGESKRESLRQLLAAGELHAVMAFEGEEPVGWCTFGPRTSFPRWSRTRALQREWGPGTWSIVCFYIHAKWRRRGVGKLLARSATAECFARGAVEVEAFPVITARTLPGPFVWTGVPAMFAGLGYRPEGRVYIKKGPA